MSESKLDAIEQRNGVPEPEFDWAGGLLCLDFANTLPSQPDKQGEEVLNSYPDLVSWSKQAGLLTDVEVKRLLQEAIDRPGDAAGALKRSLTLRRAIHRIFSAITEGSQPIESDLATVNSALARAVARSRIVPKGGGFTWACTEKEDALDRVVWPVVWSATDLLTSEFRTLVECAAPDCHYLFLDTSRNRSRRWCDMKVCGNRAKARKHYQRKKKATK